MRLRILRPRQCTSAPPDETLKNRIPGRLLTCLLTDFAPPRGNINRPQGRHMVALCRRYCTCLLGNTHLAKAIFRAYFVCLRVGEGQSLFPC